MAGTACAVVGVGQTKHAAAARGRVDRRARARGRAAALDDAGMTWADIDAVVIGKAPDMFEGVMMPELYLADALGAVGKPMIRVHTAGSVGGSTAHRRRAASSQAGVHERVLTVAFEKQSESNAMWALSVPDPVPAAAASPAPAATSPRTSARTCAARARPTTSASSWRSRTACNALQEPVRAPARCPTSPRDGRGLARCCGTRSATSRRARRSDGAMRDGARPTRTVADAARRRRPRGSTARRCAASRRCSPAATRSTRRPARTAPPTSTRRPASPTRARRSTAPRCTCRSRWYEPMWLENLGFAAEGEGWKLTEAGATAARRRHPVEPVGRRAVVEPDRRVGHAPLRRGGACRCAARPASTRSTAPARRSATPTAAARSSSPCGSWERDRRSPERSSPRALSASGAGR